MKEDKKEKTNLPAKIEKDWIPHPPEYWELPDKLDEDFEDIGQADVDVFLLPAVIVAEPRPGVEMRAFFNQIGGQEICEGLDWEFDVSGKLESSGFPPPVDWYVDQKALDGGPALDNLQITNGNIEADIPGESGDQSVSGADDIIKDQNYQIAVGVSFGSGLGSVGTVFNLKVLAAPEWKSFQIFKYELDNNFADNLLSRVENNPTSFDFVSQPTAFKAWKAVPGTNPGTAKVSNRRAVEDPIGLRSAPLLRLVFSATFGQLYFTTSQMPRVNWYYEYRTTIRARNNCGWSDYTFSIFLQEFPPAFYLEGKYPNINILVERNEDQTDFSYQFASHVGQDESNHGGGFYLDRNVADFYVFLRDANGNIAYRVTGADPTNYVPNFTINRLTGEATLQNRPLVLGPDDNSNYPYAVVEAYIQIVNMNGAGGVASMICQVKAVAPTWTSRTFTITIPENTKNRKFTFNKLNDITNYDFSHSDTDKVTFSLVHSHKWCSINSVSGTVTINTPEVTGSRTVGTPNYNPSDTYIQTIRATNNAGFKDKRLTVVVDNTTETLGPVEAVDDEPFPEGNDGTGGVASFSVEEEEPFSFGIRGFLDAGFFTRNSNHRWSLYAITAHTGTAPSIVIGRDIFISSSTGTLSGTAPLVEDRHEPYTITVSLTSAITQPAGPDGTRPPPIDKTFLITVFLTIRQKAPILGELDIDDIEEKSEINFSIADFCEHDPTEYEIGGGTALRRPASGENPPPPPPVLNIDNQGNITSRASSPDIEQPESYSYPLTLRNTINYPTRREREQYKQEDYGTLFLNIIETLPIWKRIEIQTFSEGDDILIALRGFVLNDPDTFSLVSKSTPMGAPSFDITINAITGVLTGGEAPLVEQRTDYTVVARCRNSAGDAVPDGTFTIRIENKKPDWIGTDTFQMNEGTTKGFGVSSYMNPLTDVKTYTYGTPRLTNPASFTGLPTPTLTATVVGNAENGNFSCTASVLEGQADALFVLPVIARNNKTATETQSSTQNFIIRVINLDQIQITCSNQTFPELRPFGFNINATGAENITYSKVSGAAFASVNLNTGRVSGIAPEVTGTIAANPSDSYSVRFRASGEDAEGNTVTVDCDITITILNRTVPPPNTKPVWTPIRARNFRETSIFSYNVGGNVTGNPNPTISKRDEAGTPDFIIVSENGQISGTGPNVGSNAAVATRDGLVWKITLSRARLLSASQVTIPTSVLGTGNEVEETISATDDLISDEHFIIFKNAVSALQINNVRIQGSPSVSVRSLEQSWYSPYTAYLTGSNTAGDTHTSCILRFINTDVEITVCVPPRLNIPDITMDELSEIDLDLKDYVSGTDTDDNPMTFVRSLVSGSTTARYSFADWTANGGRTLTLTEAGRLQGQLPRVGAGGTQDLIFITAGNDCGDDPDIFRINTDDTAAPHEPPVWDIGNKRYLEGTGATIDPITNGEVTGTPRIILSVTDPDNVPLPSFITQQGNLFIVSAPQITDGNDIVGTVGLTAKNYDDNNVEYSADVTFTVTITEDGRPVWELGDQTGPEGSEIDINPIRDGQLTGRGTMTIAYTTGYTPPTYLTLNQNALGGTRPEVAGNDPNATISDPVRLTASNEDENGNPQSTNHVFNLITTNVVEPVIEHTPPTWVLTDKEIAEGITETYDFVGDGLVTGSPTIVISATDAINHPFPDWGTLSNGVLTIVAPDVPGNDPDATIVGEFRLRATNTDSAGTSYPVDHIFKVTVTNIVPVIDNCEPIRFRGIRKVRLGTGTSGVIDIRSRIRGTPPIRVFDDPDYHSLSFFTNPTNHADGLISYSIPGRRRDYQRLIDNNPHTVYLIGENPCGEDKIGQRTLPNGRVVDDFQIIIFQSTTNPPRIRKPGPDLVMDAGSSYSGYPGNLIGYEDAGASLNSLLISTHESDSPKWRKKALTSEYEREIYPWQEADWWTVDELGNTSFNPPINLVGEDTTNQLLIEAWNLDGTDDLAFRLTVNYIPVPPTIGTIDPIEFSEGEIIGGNKLFMGNYVTNYYNMMTIDLVERVTPNSPPLFLKTDDDVNNVGQILGSTNTSGSRGIGTEPLLPAGLSATVDTRSAPNVGLDTDYRVTFTITNTTLITTPRHPRNSDQASFIFRVLHVDVDGVPPSWVDIPLQTSVSGESVTKAIGQYARNNPTSYEIRSVTQTTGTSVGTIILVVSNTGIVTRQANAVAPNVNREIRFNVVIRAINDDGNADKTYEWRVIPATVEPTGVAFLMRSYTTVETHGYDIQEWDPTRGPLGSRIRISSVGKGFLYIEGLGATLYGLTSSTRELVTISYTGTTATMTVLGTVTSSDTITQFRGLTTVGSILYTFGQSGGVWRLYSIDPVARTAARVNTAVGANNFGISGVNPGGLTAISTTIYSVVQYNSTDQAFISIPSSGTNRGIATVIDSDIAGTHSFIDGQIFGMETFGNVLQFINTFTNSSRAAFNVNRTNGNLSTSIWTEADNPRGAEMTSITSYAIQKPVITRIPIQLVQEGQPISFPLGGYVTGATRFRIGGFSAVTTGAPIFQLQISSSGLVTGTTGNENAPEVNANSYYSMDFYAGNSAGESYQAVDVGVLNGPPIWGPLPEQFIPEGTRINFSILSFVQNNPTHFSIISIQKPRGDAPTLQLQINSFGTIYGIGVTEVAPEVTMDERYILTLSAENTAGPRQTTQAITIQDTGTAAEQVPFIERWDLPDEPQDGPFDILVDFNIPVTALCPGSFVIEGIELRGTPNLFWSPIPANDTAANRPTADTRSLHYLNSPVPVRGTKYYKLHFSRDVLPETVRRDLAMNIYLTANSARGGRRT